MSPARPEPVELPQPLPRGVLPAILSRGRMLLCLDFDGTISEIVPHPADARPLEGIAQLLIALTHEPSRLHVAIVTGREVAEVRRMLGIFSGIMFSGTHGMELVGVDGVRRVAGGVENSAGELAKVRQWLKQNVAGGPGFVIEDKRNAIAMHYRMAEPGVAVEKCAALADFVGTETPALRILRGKQVAEVLPHGISNKGLAIQELDRELGEPRSIPVYFGDDTTDEDAFYEVRESGVGILVGAPRPSWARYRVDSPLAVASVLAELAQGLAHAPK